METDAILDGETFVGFNEKSQAIEVVLPQSTNNGITYITKIS